MSIKDDDFILTPASNDASPFWDLQLLVTIKPKDKEPRQEFKIMGYGMTLASAIRHIANYRVLHKNGDGVVSLKKYIEEYKTEIDKIDLLCQNQKRKV